MSKSSKEYMITYHWVYTGPKLPGIKVFDLAIHWDRKLYSYILYIMCVID